MKRWEPCERYIGTGEYVADMQKDSDGDYVLHADAEAEIKRLRKLLDDAEALIVRQRDERHAAIERAVRVTLAMASLRAPNWPTVAAVMERLKEQR